MNNNSEIRLVPFPEIELTEYSEAVHTTAIYPELGKNLLYPCLGLIGECGELVEKIAQQKINVLATLDELGDVFWYLNALHFELKSYCCKNNVIFVRETFEEQIKETSLKDEYSSSLMAVVQLVVSTGKIAEILKKVQRDNNGKYSEERVFKIVGYYNHIIGLIKILIDRLHKVPVLHCTIGHICYLNKVKLLDRKQRNVIQGEGDRR